VCTQGCAALHPGLIWGHPVGVREIRGGACTQGCAALHPGLLWGHPVGVAEAEVWAGAMWSMALLVLG